MATRSLSARERGFFLEYLSRLEAAGIPPLLLRNYDGFPESIGNDLDLFIPRENLKAATKLFRDLLAANGGELLMQNPRDYVLDLRFVFDGPVANALHLDLYHGAFVWHGQPYLSTARLLEDAIAHPNGFRVPRRAHEALNLTLASLLWGSFFKERYQPRIATLMEKPAEQAEFTRCMEWAFGVDTSLGFDPAAAKSPEKEIVQRSARRLRKALMRTAFRCGRISMLARWARHWVAEGWTMLRPRGLQIAILGPDGSGKSTAIAGIRERFAKIFVDTHLHHWRPSILPEVGVLLGKRRRQEGPVDRPHDKPVHPAAVSLIRVLYYLMDYWIGFFPHIWKRKAQSHLVIFDRYAADMWCDPRRYRLGLPDRILRAMSALVPVPDFTFVLLANAEILRQRKGEVGEEAVNEMLSRYRRFVNLSPRHILVDASQTEEVVIDQIEQVLRAHLYHRESRR